MIVPSSNATCTSPSSLPNRSTTQPALANNNARSQRLLVNRTPKSTCFPPFPFPWSTPGVYIRLRIQGDDREARLTRQGKRAGLERAGVDDELVMFILVGVVIVGKADVIGEVLTKTGLMVGVTEVEP
jgi:hypothetical protein